MCQKPNMIERPAGKESYKSIQIIQFLTLSHPHDMLMAHDQSLSAKFAKKIQSPRRNIVLFSVGSVQSIVRFKWSSPWSSYCRIMNHTTKIHTKKRRKSCSESLQLRPWEAVKPEAKLWSGPATRTRRHQRSTYQSSLCHHGRPTIRVPYTLGFPPKHARTARYWLQKTGFCSLPFYLFELEEWCSEGCHFREWACVAKHPPARDANRNAEQQGNAQACTHSVQTVARRCTVIIYLKLP